MARTLASRFSTPGKYALHVVLWRNGWTTPPPCCGEVFEKRFQDLLDKLNVSIRSNQDQTIFSRNFFHSNQGLRVVWVISQYRKSKKETSGILASPRSPVKKSTGQHLPA